MIFWPIANICEHDSSQITKQVSLTADCVLARRHRECMVRPTANRRTVAVESCQRPGLTGGPEAGSAVHKVA